MSPKKSNIASQPACDTKSLEINHLSTSSTHKAVYSQLQWPPSHLGTGHGLVPRFLAASFKQLIGTDPSPGMIAKAKELTSKDHYSNVDFKQAGAETLPFIEKGSVDVVTAAQAVHWFDYTKLWLEMERIVRSGGTLAFWGYKDHVLPEYKRASEILDTYAYGDKFLGPYWGQPGRSIIQGLLREVKPPREAWEDVKRIEYEPGKEGIRSGTGEKIMGKRMRLGDMEEYVRTWSSVHAWKEEHKDSVRKSEGGSGDIVDEMMNEISKHEGPLHINSWQEKEVEVEWGSVILLARKK
ncbi:hypothetical protein BOTNAR_1042g00010 [Botryotinia narcissicola]|uniref:Methyltransferase type 11 domain-containing protein n=1 Tax=Botryotinia narcissicola TaxID=278944 RepID=A0A4Z1HFS4_9HELO|nr:hypothetical protein BOTNAR_1042g00010 [Botryotinia narcissicola]